MEDEKVEQPARWGILEVMGHQRWGGLIREVQDVGGTWIEVAIPPVEAGPKIRQSAHGPICIPAHTVPARKKLFSPAARYSLEWTSEENAREHIHNPLPFDGPRPVPMPELKVGHQVHTDLEDTAFTVSWSGLVNGVVDAGDGWVRPSEIVAVYDEDGRHVWGIDVRGPTLTLTPAAWAEDEEEDPDDARANAQDMADYGGLSQPGDVEPAVVAPACPPGCTCPNCDMPF